VWRARTICIWMRQRQAIIIMRCITRMCVNSTSVCFWAVREQAVVNRTKTHARNFDASNWNNVSRERAVCRRRTKAKRVLRLTSKSLIRRFTAADAEVKGAVLVMVLKFYTCRWKLVVKMKCPCLKFQGSLCLRTCETQTTNYGTLSQKFLSAANLRTKERIFSGVWLWILSILIFLK
jgi:hypothetical protein